MATLLSEGHSFSIVVSNYNYCRFLPECLDSVLKQMQVEDELIVVDDGSSDGSLDILSEYQRIHGIKVIANENRGQLDAVRTGVLAARCPVILLLDADDYYLPGYLQRVRTIFLENQGLAFVTTVPEIDVEDSDEARRTAAVISWMKFADGLIGPTRWATQLFHEFAGHPTSGLAIRADVARQVVAIPIFNLPLINIGPLLQWFVRMPVKMGNRLHISADGLIVRCTSMMGVDRYHNSSPGFFYRIHSNNMYATMSRFGQWYFRVHRKKIIIDLCRQSLGLSEVPAASELEYEICNRSWASRKTRRFRFRVLYFLYALKSKGTVGERFSAASAAIFTPNR